MNPVPILTTYLSSIYYNFISLTPSFLSGVFALRFPTQKHVCYMIRQSNHSRTRHHKIIRQVYKFWSFFSQFLFSASCHTCNIGTEYSPLHPMLTNSPSVPAVCSKISLFAVGTLLHQVCWHWSLLLPSGCWKQGIWDGRGMWHECMSSFNMNT